MQEKMKILLDKINIDENILLRLKTLSTENIKEDFSSEWLSFKYIDNILSVYNSLMNKWNDAIFIVNNYYDNNKKIAMTSSPNVLKKGVNKSAKDNIDVVQQKKGISNKTKKTLKKQKSIKLEKQKKVNNQKKIEAEKQRIIKLKKEKELIRLQQIEYQRKREQERKKQLIDKKIMYQNGIIRKIEKK